MIIRISKNFCHVEFEADDQDVHAHLGDYQTLCQDLYNMLPNTQNTGQSSSNQTGKTDEVRSIPPKASNQVLPPTQRQQHYLRETLQYTGLMPETKQAATALITKIEKNRR